MKKPAGLTRREDFLRVQSRGRRHRSPTVVLLVCTGEGTPARVGYTVSRKVGNAVVRNHVRRRMREIVRLHQELLTAGRDHVLIALPPAAAASSAELERDVLALLSRAGGAPG